MTAHLDVGDDFGTYRIVEVVGDSAMGRVYAATQDDPGRVEALKVLTPSWIDADDFRDRFARDALTLARLDSPHIVHIHAHGDVGGTPYIATDLIRGGDLSSYLQARGALSAQLALEIASQVASALEDAHGVGVIHANLKPTNVLLREGGDPFVLLCDFGIARSESAGLTTTTAVGTWAYLAPERCSGGEATVASDIYSAGCLLWALLTGEAPYRGTDLEVAVAHLRDPIPQLDGDDEQTLQVNAVLARTMSKSPAHRFATAGELREALVELAGSLGGQTTALTPAGPVEQVTPPDPVEQVSGPVEQPTAAGPVEQVTPPDPRPLPVTPLVEPVPSDDSSARRSIWPPWAYQPGIRSLGVLALAVVLVVGAGAVLLGRSPDSSAGAPSSSRSSSPSSSPTPSPSPSRSPSPSPSSSASASPRSASGTPTASRPRQSAAQLARLTRDSYAGGPRSLVSVRSLTSTVDDIRAIGLTGKRSVVASTWRLPAGAGVTARTQSRVNGDFDGDRRTDVAFVDDRPNGNGAILVARSTGNGFAAPTSWGVTPRTTSQRISTVAGDFDGDGHLDLAIVQGRTSSRSVGVTVLLSTGTRFRKAVSWATRLPWDASYVKLEPGDFNSDGRTDLVAFVGDSSQDAVQVRMLLSNGKRLTTPAPSWYGGNFPTTDLSDIRPVAGDFDGDGSTDIMVFTPEFFTGNLEALFLASDRKQFSRADVPWWTSSDWTLSGTRMSVGDFDGNGRSDVACLLDGGGRGVQVQLLLASAARLEPKAGVNLPKRSFSSTGIVDATG